MSKLKLMAAENRKQLTKVKESLNIHHKQNHKYSSRQGDVSERIAMKINWQ